MNRKALEREKVLVGREQAPLERFARSRFPVLFFFLSLGGCEDCNGKPVGGAPDGAAAAPSASASGPSERLIDGGSVNATPVKNEDILAMVNPEKLPAYSGETGSIEGTVTVTGDLSPPPRIPGDFTKCKEAEATWGKAFREGPGTTTDKRSLADAVVVVTGYSGFYIPEKREAVQATIEGCAYTARTVTLTFGQRLEVKNNTREFWTPTLEPGTNMVLMMAAPKGDPVKVYPKKPGHYLLLDRDRKYAVVDVYAFLHPLHAVTSTSGAFRIDGVPVGKLKVSTMHPQVNGSDEKEIEVSAGGVTKVALTVRSTLKDAGPLIDEDAGYHPKLR